MHPPLHLMKKTSVLLAVTLLFHSFAFASTRIAGFDAADLTPGDVTVAEIQKASQQQDNLSKKTFEFGSKSPLRFEVLSDGKSGQLLRMHFPESQTESRGVYTSFRDSQMAEYLDPSAPLSLEVKLKSSSESNPVSGEVIFAHEGKFLPFRIFRASSSGKSEKELSFDLSAKEPTTIKITFSPQVEGIMVHVSAKSDSGLSEESERILPGTENFTLADLHLLTILSSPEEGAPNAYLDFFSLLLSQ